MAAAPFADRLLRWFDRERRDLPWRHTDDPWSIWVSEVMLQQTRVEAVREPYVRFLQRFPDPAAFAAADDDALMAAWRGLGYYRRARLLRQGAQEVRDRHGGDVPRDPAVLGQLPGVGAYTRGAIASIAFGLPEPAIDGNVERVVTRHRGLRDDVALTRTRREIDRTVRGWLDARRAGDFNQALMELGATVCTPRVLACERCPVAADCRGRQQGIAAGLPVRRPPRPAVAVSARALLVALDGDVLAFRVPPDEPNAGQWELPGPGLLRTVGPEELAAATAERCGVRIDVGSPLVSVRHAITHHRIVLTAHAGELSRRRPSGLVPLAPDDPAVPWTTATRKVFARLRGGAAAEA